MDFLKKYFDGKAFGYYVSLAITVLFLVAGIIYVTSYGNDVRDYQLWTTVSLFVGFALSLVLTVLRQDKVTPYVQGVFGLAALCLYIRKIYWYVSEVFVGIDEVAFSGRFILVTTFLAVLFVVALVNCFLPQIKREVIVNE